MLSTPPRLRFLCLAVLVALTCSDDLFGYTKAGTTYTTNGSQSDVSAAIANASTGDTVSIPVGSFTWGAGGTCVSVNKAITLQGAGPGGRTTGTTINLSATGSGLTSGVIRISAAAVVKGFTIITPASSGSPTAFSITSAANGFRITNVTYDNSSGHAGYYIYTEGYGLIDSSSITCGGDGTQETIFARGLANSWQTADSMGGANALYVEDCTIGGTGYVCDINDNGRAVFRFNTITGPNKIDGHGYFSNSLRGVRQMEVYNNHWTGSAGWWAALALRGGTGRVFDNIMDNSQATSAPMFTLEEYGCYGIGGHFGSTYITPAQYPATDQIGVGEDPKAAASDPYYVWHNTKAGVAWALDWEAVAAGAITQYRSSFTMQDVVGPDRDFFLQGATFNGSSGVGGGTKAQMLAITATKTGVGFWVTDEGSWNTKLPANTSGQLYTWNGSAWVLKYTPYTYPHPLRGIISPPTIATTSINVQ